mgnify:CR=1 FL=1
MEAIKKIEINKIVKLVLIAVCGTLLLTISSKIKIPFYPVPMTMQTFVVLLLGITLGSKIGLLTVSLYLFEGIFGLPVFAGTPEKGIGLIYFTGPTMGYLIGFLVAVFFAEFLKIEKTNLKNIFFIFFKLIFSVFFIYFFGLIWLSTLIGWEKAYKFGAQPFLLAELFKILLLTALYPWIIKIRKFI